MSGRGQPALLITPEGPLREDPWRKGPDPHVDEMEACLPARMLANRHCIRAHVRCLSVPAQGVRRAHGWLRTRRLPAETPDCRAVIFRRMTTPCHNDPRGNEHTPRLRVYRTWTDRAGSGVLRARRSQVRDLAHL